ncbi:nucleotide sugar dehydrogenase [Pseudalkalibacillus hwajinpoensis]|uniref:nucleotide sugar dehydrogenase n=1 Tax=Guptibacillus hwajinpoensis TaxID=208199 RepID=UPI001CD7119B|nr:nucleotide sugar dehydrogenase [Pseudalkalibacillus hwajinpoensis]MCA0990008.1 nucleotide sugar dehydrogenase [Pseudalkalibacillus hwajinpoensis]
MKVKSNSEQKRIGVIGLGYVGLPLALLFVKKGFHVIGIDIDTKKIEQLNNGGSYLPDISGDEIRNAMSNKELMVVDNYDVIQHLDVIIICVPTPLGKNSNPDLSFLTHVANELKNRLEKEQVVILESSTYPGTTTDVLKPILEQRGFLTGKDYFLGYSPERIDPGNKNYELEQIPKVVSGVTVNCGEKVCEIYSKVFHSVQMVSSTRVAEMTKLLENSYRLINISFVNEIAMLCDHLSINIWEVIEAASSKPFGYTPFYPGPGIGGHCIPVDPIYFDWKAKQKGMNSQFINLSTKTNRNVTNYIVKKLEGLTNQYKENSVGKILLCGVGYKRDNNDIRESPSIVIMKKLIENGFEVNYHDPLIPELKIEDMTYYSVDISKEFLVETDCVVILTQHSCLDVQYLIDNASVIFDTRNATNGLNGNAEIFKFGCGEF